MVEASEEDGLPGLGGLAVLCGLAKAGNGDAVACSGDVGEAGSCRTGDVGGTMVVVVGCE